jgi:hypothetical protein
MSDRLTAEELAKALRVSLAAIRQWTREGIPYLPCGRLRFYDRHGVEAWLRERDEQYKRARAQRRHAKLQAQTSTAHPRRRHGTKAPAVPTAA